MCPCIILKHASIRTVPLTTPNYRQLPHQDYMLLNLPDQQKEARPVDVQVGPAGVGKSQLCHMLAVSALLPWIQQQQADMQAHL